MPRKYLAFDIEIASELPEDRNWDLAQPLGISCIATQIEGQQPVVWLSRENDRPAPRMTMEDLRKVIAYLQQQVQAGLTILTWNGLRFDFHILAQESLLPEACEDLAVSHVDLMFHVFCELGYYLSLDSASQGMGLPGKPAGITGAQAPRLWQAGEFDQVLRYVANDVGMTTTIARACEQRRCLCWKSKRGRPMQLALPRGWLIVRDAAQLPVPDTSWMDAPISRSDFVRWLRHREIGVNGLIKHLPSTQAASPLDDQRVTQSDVAELKNRLLSREHDYQQLKRERQARTWKMKRCKGQVRYFSTLSWVRELFQDVALGRIGPSMISTGLGALVGVVLGSVFSGSTLLGGLVGSLVLLLIALHLFWWPTDRFIEQHIATKREQIANLHLLLTRDEPAFLQAASNTAEVRGKYELLVAKFNSRRNILLNTDWRTLRGTPFEEYLQGIFECLGCKVRRTGKTGDQGVDLIVETKNSKLAVQAKGYAETVGNKSVQEVHTGMIFYQCNRCVVITNSTFTAAAIDLARHVGCALIDGSKIDALILGKFDL